MKIALYIPNPERQQNWTTHLAELLPQHSVIPYDAITNPLEIDIAVVWRPPTGWLASLENLKLTVSIGAGIDHIMADENYPSNVPVLKTVGPDMAQRMREYVVLHVLNLHRRMPEIQHNQSDSSWHQLLTPIASSRKIGIMGLGGMGLASAKALAALDFTVSAWSSSPHELDGIANYSGDAQLGPFLNQSDILVCLLPLTEKTKGILNSSLFQQLPIGASIINAARGAHLLENDLLEALASGQLAHATLDVFAQEPLPEEHPFWSHPKVTVTPHIASLIDPTSGGHIIANNIERFIRGDDLPDMADTKKRY